MLEHTRYPYSTACEGQHSALIGLTGWEDGTTISGLLALLVTRLSTLPQALSRAASPAKMAQPGGD